MRYNNRPAHLRQWSSGRLGSTALSVALLLAVAVVVAVASQDPPAAPPVVQKVHVLAERFSFSPSEIKTTVGTTLEIQIESDDTAHGFRIIGTDVNIEVPKRGRGTKTVTFKAETAGRYTFECSQLCGAGHSFMRGVIVVSEARPAGPR